MTLAACDRERISGIGSPFGDFSGVRSARPVRIRNAAFLVVKFYLTTPNRNRREVRGPRGGWPP